MGRTLILIGAMFIIIGLAWPWLAKLGLFQQIGRLPGDIVIRREGFSLYIPIVTSPLISAVLTALFWMLRR
ncbi:MAG: DUF2905 family protein [Alphaproteobacteria bacterium]|nr:DUF2905 family protein [Alphaproteobacteria bacterium]